METVRRQRRGWCCCGASGASNAVIQACLGSRMGRAPPPAADITCETSKIVIETAQRSHYSINTVNTLLFVLIPLSFTHSLKMSSKDYYGAPVEKPGPVYQGHGQREFPRSSHFAYCTQFFSPIEQYGQHYSGQPQYSGQQQYYAQPQPQPQMVYVQQPPRNDSSCGAFAWCVLLILPTIV